SDHTGGSTMESRTVSLLLLFVLIGIHWPVVAESVDPAVPESACPSHPAVLSVDADPDARKPAASHARCFLPPTFDDSAQLTPLPPPPLLCRGRLAPPPPTGPPPPPAGAPDGGALPSRLRPKDADFWLVPGGPPPAAPAAGNARGDRGRTLWRWAAHAVPGAQ